MNATEVKLESRASHPPVGQLAPHFTALSTHGSVSLRDYRGSWVILVSQPFDLCPTLRWQQPRFEHAYHELQGMNCEFLGVVADESMNALCWCLNAREELGIKIWFPIISDTDCRIAKLYGMIMSGTHESFLNHSMYVIDPHQILRAVIYYDAHAFDTMEQLVQIIRLIQASEACGVVTKEARLPGEEWVLHDEHPRSELPGNPKRDDDMWYF